MKKINNSCKVLSAVIVVLLVGFMIKVNAVTISTDNTKHGESDANSSYVTNTAVLTVTGIQSGDSFKAYKLLDAYYNNATNAITYQFTNSFKAFLSNGSHNDFTVDDYFELTSGSITSGSTQTASTLDALVSGYVSYIKKNSVNGFDMTVSGNTVSATLVAGAYLVLPVSTTRVYATMVGNLDFEASGSEWVLNNEAIAAKVSDAGIVKSVSDTAGKNLMNTEFSYTIVGTVPQYPTNATNKVYKITDTMDEGISFGDIETFAIKDGETTLVVSADGKVKDATGNVVATIALENQKMTVVFDVNYVTSTSVTVTYKAKLNEGAVLGDAGNKNSAVLTYSNDPYGTGTYDTTNDEGSEGEVVVRAYGLEILKYAGADKATVLEGAEFDVYSDAALTSKSKVGTVVTGTDGIARLAGLTEGTYYLKETKAPTGYRALNDAIEVKIKSDGAVAADTTGYYKAEISNVRNGILPFTGGSGLIVYSLFGILIIGIGSYLVVEKQKKKKLNVQV